MGKTTNGNGYCERLDDGRWKCVVSVIIEKKRKRFSAISTRKAEAEKQAQAKAELYRKSILAGVVDPNEERKKTFKNSFIEYWEEYKEAKGLGSMTIISNEKMIYTCLFNSIDELNIPIGDINARFYNDIIKNINKKYKPSVGGRLYNYLYRHYKAKVKKVLTNDFWDDDVNKIVDDRKKKERDIDDFENIEEELEIFTEDEIKKLKNEVEILADCHGMNDYQKKHYLEFKQDCRMFYLMFLIGARGGEVRALTENDIDFENRTLRISKAFSLKQDEQGKEVITLKPPKNETSNRVIGLNSTELNLLKDIISNRPERKIKTDKGEINSPYLFMSDKGYLTFDDFRYRFKRVLKELDIEKGKRHPHSLRHSFISYSIDNNPISPLKDKSIIFISRYVGHKKLSTTLDVYTHIAKHRLTEIEDDIKVIDPIEEIDFK